MQHMRAVGFIWLKSLNKILVAMQISKQTLSNQLPNESMHTMQCDHLQPCQKFLVITCDRINYS